MQQGDNQTESVQEQVLTEDELIVLQSVIPKIRPKFQLNLKIVMLRDSRGLSWGQISLKLGLTKRQVQGRYKTLMD